MTQYFFITLFDTDKSGWGTWEPINCTLVFFIHFFLFCKEIVKLLYITLRQLFFVLLRKTIERPNYYNRYGF